MSILVNKNSRIVCQGITGRQGSFHTEQCIEYGTQVVAGVTPGRGGEEHLGVPVYDSVRAAVEGRQRVRFAFILDDLVSVLERRGLPEALGP